MYSLNASTSFKTLKKALTLTTSLVSDQRPIIMGRYTEDFEEKELLDSKYAQLAIAVFDLPSSPSSIEQQIESFNRSNI
ncbi:uncharacterized protein LOC107769732 isoform X5 [Nicotiana tabacum]|uniref:Uncharacterized protein LOC107769732 isoform X5 n=1 Tax=Nicotiana tabacum TaxID=4097 RepID=A0AC58TBH2_TOBAC